MKVRAWYGLRGDIEVEYELWHLVRVGGMALPRPPLVNLVLRRGLPREDRLRLSYLLEFGHIQTLALDCACCGLRAEPGAQSWAGWHG